MTEPTPHGTRASAGASGRDIDRRVLLGGMAAALAPAGARAQQFPSKPIRIMVPSAPGASMDMAGRLISAKLNEALGTPVIVENKAGAAGSIGVQAVVDSQPDGHTLGVSTGSPIIIAPQTITAVRYNPLTDLTFINMISSTSIAIALSPSIQAGTIGELAELSKKKPITMALPLLGSVSHLVAELVAKVTGCRFQNVPFPGGVPALNSVLGGHVEATVSDVGVLMPMHKAGRLRIVFLTAGERADFLPGVQVASEVDPRLEVMSWTAIFAPSKTPTPVIDKINAAVTSGLEDASLKAQLNAQWASAHTMADPETFKKFVASEYTRFGAIIREQNIKIE